MDAQDQKEHCDNLIGNQLNQILSKLMQKNKISLTILHRNTGIAIPTLKRLQSDPTANPTISTLLPIANFFGISLNQLIGTEHIPDHISGFIEEKKYWLRVPVIAWKQSCHWPSVEISTSNFVFTDAEVGNNPYALIIEEDDWMGFLKNSFLIINYDLKPSHKDYAIIHKVGQDIPTLKQIIRDEDKVYLKSLNTYSSPTPLDEYHRFLGVLIQVTNTIKP